MTENILYYAFLVNLPLFFMQMLFYSHVFSFRDKMQVKNIAVYAVVLSIIEGISKMSFQQNYHTLISTGLSIALLIIMFRIKPLTAFLSYIFITAIDLILQVILILPFTAVTGIEPGQIASSLHNSIMFTYPLLIFKLIIVGIIYKLGWSIKLFKKYELFSNTAFEAFMSESYKYLMPLCATIFAVIASAFLLFDRQAITNISLTPFMVLSFIMVISALFVGLCIWFMKEVLKYKELSESYESIIEFLEGSKK